MKLKDLTTTISIVVKEAVDNAFSYVGMNAEKLSKAQAQKRYGRANVDRWLSEGLIELIGKKLSTEQLAGDSVELDHYVPGQTDHLFRAKLTT